MSTFVLEEHAGRVQPASSLATVRIGLLGLGNVGSAFARLTARSAHAFAAHGFAPAVTAALVRSPLARAGAPVRTITSSADEFFSQPIDVVVEALGGVDAAAMLVRRALERGLPVVTANKSLVAARGDELARLARRRGTAFRFEASCIAGVPFLGTFERRPLASAISALSAVLNGTSNYILTEMADADTPFERALANAQRLGLAERDPSMDIAGTDAAEKLSILIRLFGRLIVGPAAIPAEGIDDVEPGDLKAAAELEGALRPVACASWSGRAVQAFVGPVFLPRAHPLARVTGVTNAVHLNGDHGALSFACPGAGPDVTAATLLDDVAEIVSERRVRPPAAQEARAAARVTRPDTGWFVRLPGVADPVALLESRGLRCTRTVVRDGTAFALTAPASAERIAAAGASRAFPALAAEEGAC